MLRQLHNVNFKRGRIHYLTGMTAQADPASCATMAS